MSNQYKTYSNKHFTLHQDQNSNVYYLRPMDDTNVVRIVLNSKPFYFAQYDTTGNVLLEKKLYQANK